MRRLGPLLLLSLLASPALAQTGVLTVSWTASGDPAVASYRVYYGLSASALDSLVEVPATQASVLLTGLIPLTTYFVQVTSVRSDGCESVPSAVVPGLSSNPGPECTSVSPSVAVQGAAGLVITLTGLGFEAGPSVRFTLPPLDSVPISIGNVQLIGSTEIRFTVDVASETPAEAMTVEVSNQDPTQAPSNCTTPFVVQVDPGRTDVNGSGRVDGFDVASLGAVFGAFDQVCSPDAPAAAARGARCDSEDDCGGTVGATGFCTSAACQAIAPQNGEVACRIEEDCGGTTGGTAFCRASPYRSEVDLDGNGIVDGLDLSLMTPQFGASVP